MPVGRGGEKTVVSVSTDGGRGRPFVSVTVWPSASLTNEQHIAFQAFLFSVKRLQDVFK